MTELATDIGDLMQSVGMPVAAIELTPRPDWVTINLLKEGMPLEGE
jgi:hypothetical protein